MDIVMKFYKMAILIIAGCVLSCAHMPTDKQSVIEDAPGAIFLIKVHNDGEDICSVDEDGNVWVRKDLNMDLAKKALGYLMLENVKLHDRLMKFESMMPDPVIPMVRGDDMRRDI